MEAAQRLSRQEKGESSLKIIFNEQGKEKICKQDLEIGAMR